MAKLSADLPTKIEAVFDLPKVGELVHATSRGHVVHFVATELARLTMLVNVSGNLNADQIDFIAEHLVDEYPAETLADFKICFNRGAMGAFGPIFRLDGGVIGEWMKKHLATKYERFEAMPKEKPFSLMDLPDERLEEIKQAVAAAPMSRPSIPMSPADIKREGAIDPPKVKAKYYPHGTPEANRLIDLKTQYGRECTDKYTGKVLPGKPKFAEWVELNGGNA